jgi:hypothetical protein
VSAMYGSTGAQMSLADRFQPKPRDTALLYAERRLRVWSDWAKDNHHGLGYPSVSTIYKAMRQKSEQIKRNAPPRMLTAYAVATRPASVPEPDVPDSIREVDIAVAQLPQDLRTVIMADCFTYGPIEVRAKQTRWKRARYSQLLECAKYSVFCWLASRTEPDVQGQGRSL